jgi:flagella basal body P-ring formation protein FlgA
MASTNMASMAVAAPVRPNAAAQIAAPLLVHAGDRVRLWSQDERVRIEISGVVEQSARVGDRVMVQVTRRNEETGMSVERISGIVRAAGDVEMQP